MKRKKEKALWQVRVSKDTHIRLRIESAKQDISISEMADRILLRFLDAAEVKPAPVTPAK